MKIDETNIEAILFDYAEGNLNDAERRDADKYLSLHPEYRRLLEMYDTDATIDKPFEIIYDRKEELYGQITARKRPNIVLISKYVKWISATAAAIALFVVIKGYNNFLNNEFSVQDDKNLALNGDFAEKNKSLTNEYQCKKENEKSFEKEDVSFGANKVSFHVSEMTFGRSKATFGDNETTLDVNQSADNENQIAIIDSTDALSAEKNGGNKGLNDGVQAADGSLEIADADLQNTKCDPVEIYEQYTTVYQTKEDLLSGLAEKYLPLQTLKNKSISTVCAVASAIDTSKMRKWINRLAGRKNGRQKIIRRQERVSQKENV